MPTVERTMAQPGTAAEAESALRDYARAAGLRAGGDVAAGGLCLAGGEPLGFNLNTLRRRLRVEGIGGPGAMLRLSASADALPWERPRVRRALEGHLDDLARRLRGETARGEPFAAWVRPSSTGIPSALGGILLSGLFAVLAAMLVMGAYGLVQVNETAFRLAEQGARIRAMGDAPLPSPESLRALTWGDRFAAAAFFAASFGWLGGGLLALAWGLGELVPRWSRLGSLAVTYVGLVFLAFLVPAGPAVPAALSAVLLPAAAWIGYGIPWSLRRAVPAASGVSAPSRGRVALVLGGFVLLGAGVGVAFYRLAGLNAGAPRESAPTASEESLVGFRDRILLGTDWGRAFSDAYYRNTTLPAEAIRPPLQSQQRVALVLGNPLALPVRARLGRQWQIFVARGGGNGWFYVDALSSPASLEAALRPLPEIVFWVPSAARAEEDPFHPVLRARAGDLSRRLVVVGGPPDLVAGGGPFAGAQRVDVPATPARLGEAVRAVLEEQDGARGLPVIGGLRNLVWIAILALVVGAGLLLAALVAWSAWAWAALGASAAGGRAQRALAWCAGPVVALVAWGALALAAVGGAGGPCPPSTPFPDPVRALDAAAPCDRLAAAQQLIGEAERNPAARAAAVREALRRRLSDPDPRVRFWAAAAASVWGEAADRLLLSPLADRLRDPDLRVRYRAARTLGAIGDASVVEPLRRMTLDDDVYVADYARAALRMLAVRGLAR